MAMEATSSAVVGDLGEQVVGSFCGWAAGPAGHLCYLRKEELKTLQDEGAGVAGQSAEVLDNGMEKSGH